MLSYLRGLNSRIAAVAVASAALTFLAPERARGQQTCLVPTDDAKRMITVYLQIEPTLSERQAHGITAQWADSLTPLTDTHTGLCRRMDSTFTHLPAYYFRANNVILGTNYSNPPANRNEFARFVFVFDTLGTRFAPRQRAYGPQDIHVTTALSGLVELEWTNIAASVDSYRLQRATGNGAFAYVAGTISGGATSTADTTAATSNTYRYRLVAFRAGADSGFSNEFSITVSELGPITRPTSGLVYRDTFNRADGAPGADWVAESGTWTITSNALHINIPYFSSAVMRLAALPARKDFHIQVQSSRSQIGNYAAVYGRRAGGAL